MSVIAKFKRDRPNGAAPATPAANPDAPILSAMDRAVARKRFTFGRIAAGLLILLLLAAGGYAYVRYGLQKSLAMAQERLTISKVQKATFSDYVPVTGLAAPEETVFLDTVEGGQVTGVLIEDGAAVQAGEPLARLKNTRLELEVLGREAQLTEQQNYLANARLAFQQSELRNQRDMMTVERDLDRLNDQLVRQKPLENEGVAKSVIFNLEADIAHKKAERESIAQSQKSEREVAKSNLAQLELSIQRMQQSLGLVRQNLDNLTISAPIGGQLTGFDLKIGEVVNPGQRIGQVDSVGTYKVTAMVDEFYLGRVAAGQKASLETEGATFAMTVSKVYPDVKERQFQVDLRFAGDIPKAIRRGQSMRPRIELGETADSLIVANGPFYDETGGAWVMVVSADGSYATRRKVTLGRRNPDAIEIVSGLAAGERIVTSSYEAFKDIERVDFN